MIGEEGLILHTTDGGDTWMPQNSNCRYWLEAVAFVDAKNGWAVGEAGCIIRTRDGGATWQVQESGTRKWLYSISFSDGENGWAVERVDSAHHGWR